MSSLVIRERVAALIKNALTEVIAAGDLPSIPSLDVAVDRRGDELADYASAEAMRLARTAKKAPRDIAELVVSRMAADPAVADVSVAGPGFINVRLDDGWVLEQIETILEAGAAYGAPAVRNPLRIQVEYLSANPTGPLTVGAGRVGVVGDAVARLLAARGHEVTREYYVNDAGRQIEILAETVRHHYAAALGTETEFPEGGYRGEYVATWGRTIADQDGNRWLSDDSSNNIEAFKLRSVNIALESITRDLASLGIEFDVWFSEREMRARGEVTEILEALADSGHVTQRDGATWFVGGEGAEDRENVLVRSRGDPTYLATDIAYHRGKFDDRKFDLVIDIWGADHQGHVPRMKAAMEALKIDPSRLEILVAQMVGVRSDEGLVRAGKRSGHFVTLREVIDEVGVSATRYFFLSKAIDSQMEFDLELAKREDPENPIYYIQMAHARCAGIQRSAAENPINASPDFARLGDPEGTLVRQLLAYPELMIDASDTREPHRMAHYLLELARGFHSYYNDHRVVSDDGPLTASRLQLVAAVRQVLANGLGLLGIEAPERM